MTFFRDSKIETYRWVEKKLRWQALRHIIHFTITVTVTDDLDLCYDFHLPFSRMWHTMETTVPDVFVNTTQAGIARVKKGWLYFW